MRLAACLLCALLLTGCAHRPGAGSVADSATTYVALSTGDFVEGNPLLGGMSPAVTALSILAVQQAVKYALTSAGLEHCDAHRGVETAAAGAAGWNLAMLAGVGPPGALAAGLIASTVYYRITDPATARVFSCREAR
ncbi:hypothetical protein [uncultured Halomonas sp.]|uniref:hypothetical protein n=1 Tax=uncultured Halomonas sp. TaxID=173971 RepID=UPI002612B2F6|nr:hypothetical protein [uncultured Halomonas sp.]